VAQKHRVYGSLSNQEGLISMKKPFFLCFIPLLSLACCTIPLKKEAESTRIFFRLDEVKGCEYLGEIVGSEGHWHSSWLISNRNLAMGALNDLRNNAQRKGADTIFIPPNLLLFRTSVTFIGQAYKCNKQRSGKGEGTK
jgi:hypothetical protein